MPKKEQIYQIEVSVAVHRSRHAHSLLLPSGQVDPLLPDLGLEQVGPIDQH